MTPPTPYLWCSFSCVEAPILHSCFVLVLATLYIPLWMISCTQRCNNGWSHKLFVSVFFVFPPLPQSCISPSSPSLFSNILLLFKRLPPLQHAPLQYVTQFLIQVCWRRCLLSNLFGFGVEYNFLSFICLVENIETIDACFIFLITIFMSSMDTPLQTSTMTSFFSFSRVTIRHNSSFIKWKCYTVKWGGKWKLDTSSLCLFFLKRIRTSSYDNFLLNNNCKTTTMCSAWSPVPCYRVWVGWWAAGTSLSSGV